MKWHLDSFIKLFISHQKSVKLLVYQILFTAILVLYFALVLGFYLETVDSFSPRVRNRRSQPALTIRPLPDNPYSTLLDFTRGYDGTWAPFKKSIRDYLKPYSHGKFAGSSVKCKWDHKLDISKWCHVSRRRLIDFTHDVGCTKAEEYGYARGQPCIYIMPTKLFDWEPDPYYNLTEVEHHPTMPQSVKNNINSTWTKHCQGKGDEIENKCPRLRMIWVSCEGETAADKEYMGPVFFTPNNKHPPGYPGYYFPYVNQNHYLSPLLVMQFRNLEPGILVSVVCKMWAKNIRHDTKNPFIGGTRFELRMS